jgi:CheY-like chemotaxis protein
MKTILLIEDEDIIYNLLQQKLTAEGYKVILAKDGVEGMEAMRAGKPDLILSDIIMPRKNGLEVLEEMRQDVSLANIPVIIISNSGQPVELEKVKQLGARDWLIKTEFDPKEVLEKVKKQIG